MKACAILELFSTCFIKQDARKKLPSSYRFQYMMAHLIMQSCCCNTNAKTDSVFTIQETGSYHRLSQKVDKKSVHNKQGQEQRSY